MRVVSMVLGLISLNHTSAAFADRTGYGEDSVYEAVPSRESACSTKYRDNGCAAFFRSNPQLGSYAVNCEDPERPEAIVGACVKNGILTGARDFLLLPVSLWKADPERTKWNKEVDEFYALCIQSMDCKRALWEQSHGSPPTPEQENKLATIPAWMMRNTTEMAAHQTTMRLGHRSMEAARRILATMPPGEERNARVRKFIPGWSTSQSYQAKALVSVGLEAAGRKWKGLRHGLKCMRWDVIAEAACYGLSTFITPAAGAGVAISAYKFYKFGEVVRLFAPASSGGALGHARTAALAPLTTPEEAIAIGVHPATSGAARLAGVRNHYSISVGIPKGGGVLRTDPDVIRWTTTMAESQATAPSTKILIGASPELRTQLIQSMRSVNGTKAVSCLDGVCSLLERSGFRIPGYSDRSILRSDFGKIIDSLKSGNFTYMGQRVPSGSVRMVSSSPEDLQRFLSTYSRDKDRFIVVTLGAGGAGAGSGAWVVFNAPPLLAAD